MTGRHACFAEIFGTYCLVLAGTAAIVVDGFAGGVIGHVGIAATFGLVVMVMIYAIGEISGAHMNPAVTIAFAWARRFPWRRVPAYIGAQMLGAFAASATILLLIGDAAALGATRPIADDTVGWLRCAGLEVIFTWMLMLVILGVSTGAKEKGLMAGIAVGGTVGLLALFGGPPHRREHEPGAQPGAGGVRRHPGERRRLPGGDAGRGPARGRHPVPAATARLLRRRPLLSPVALIRAARLH